MSKALILYPLQYLYQYSEMKKRGEGYLLTNVKGKEKFILANRIIRWFPKEKYVEYIGLQEGSKFEYIKKREHPDDDNFLQFKTSEDKVLTINKRHVKLLDS